MSKSNPEHISAVPATRNIASSIESALKTADDCDAWIVARDHANSDSLPLRYGVHFDSDTPLRLRGVRFLYRDEQYPDRFHIEATFEIEGRDSYPGHFVLGCRSGRNEPDVVTVWRGDVRTEFGLSELMVSLRKRGYVKPADLLELHPFYVSGQLSTAADLVHHLAVKMATGQVKDMEAEVTKATATAAKAIDALEKARRKAENAESVALEATYVVSKLEAENAELKSENARLKTEESAALLDGKEVTLSDPDTLVEVRENQLHRGSICTILIMGDGTQRHMKIKTFDQDGKVTEKAKALVGRRVRISCWDPIGNPGRWSSQGYFRNVYAAK
jgi:hypothetical protein